jgi:N-acetylglutamate synthase-like GNAT family acetyltransferase
MIRKAAQADTQAIVELLKSSLGEELLPKSEAFWTWKHIYNPFGASPVLLEEQDGKIVGVRAFMQWRWVIQGKIYRALRAVDTATHPDYQGKGIFKKLTLGLVDESIKTGYDFIFNTPNNSSKPGYLKMGWEELGKPSIRIKPFSGMLLARTRLLKRVVKPEAFVRYATNLAFRHEDALAQLVTDKRAKQVNYLTTDVSLAYLKWRYCDIPVHQYGCLHDLEDDASYCIFFRPKLTSFGIEGRITDTIINYDKLRKTDFKTKFKTLQHNFDYLSITGTDPALNSLLNELLFLPPLKVGPVLTTRNLNLENPQFLLNFNPWKPTLGDLELF